MDYAKTFRDRLRACQRNQGLSQKDLAAKVNISAATISAYENMDDAKRKNPSLENAAALAQALNVSLDWLAGLSENASPQESDCNEDEYIPLTRILREIIDITVLGCQIQIKDIVDLNSPYRAVAHISNIHDEKVVEFLRSWQKIRELYKDGVITRDMRDEWVNGAMRKYENWLISTQNGESTDLPY